MELESENDKTVTFCYGGNTRLSLSASTTGTADEQTQSVWQVTDIAAEVAALRAHGVEITEYDTDEIKTENGVADMGEELHAWFIDPAKSSLSLSRKKQGCAAGQRTLFLVPVPKIVVPSPPPQKRRCERSVARTLTPALAGSAPARPGSVSGKPREALSRSKRRITLAYRLRE